MMAVWVKALLFVGAGATAAAGTAYVTGMLDPWFSTPPQTLAAVPMQTEPKAQPPQQQEAPATPELSVPQPEDPQTTPKQARLLPPTFDLLRVEPDGSVVIAGKAAPDVSIEVLNGETVIARTNSTPDGDFVAVLDAPLEPGDYQLLLRANSGEDTVLSTETAIVSIPQKPDGEVLAMVEAPGKAAEIITAPAAAELPAGADAGPATVSPAEQDVAAEEPAEIAAEGQQPVEEKAATEPAADDKMTAEADDETAPAGTDVAAAPATDEPAADDAAATEEEADTEQETSTLPAAEQDVAAPSQPAVEGVVAVEAVEIEGDTVFVAGSATPGRIVRVYADALLLGDAKVSDGGRFLIEAKRDLPVGDYVIRADLLDADGTVIARAAVPFEREPGETIAAVAPQPQVPGTTAEEDTAAAPAEEPAAEEFAAAPEQSEEPESAKAETPTSPEEATDESGPQVAAAPPAGEDLTAPKLQKVDGAVIIRRGDNLWRISRRVYGMGIRYSTIYLANQDQISNPDRIWPGQVFSVPQETEEGDAADLEALGDQMVPPDTESKIVR